MDFIIKKQYTMNWKSWKLWAVIAAIVLAIVATVLFFTVEEVKMVILEIVGGIFLFAAGWAVGHFCKKGGKQ